MNFQADIGNDNSGNDNSGNDNSGIEALRFEVCSQRAKVRVLPMDACRSVEAKLLIAMQQNLEIMMMIRSIDPAQGVSNDHLDSHVR